MKTYMIDDSSISNSWAGKADRVNRYIVFQTSDDNQHLSDADIRSLMSAGIKTEFERCVGLEGLYMALGVRIGLEARSGYADIVLVSGSSEYDEMIRRWNAEGIKLCRQASL